jgi:hypothetical protein
MDARAKPQSFVRLAYLALCESILEVLHLHLASALVLVGCSAELGLFGFLPLQSNAG